MRLSTAGICRSMRPCHLFLLSLTFLATLTTAADPLVSVTRFQNLPSKFFYFDDTTTVIMHDPAQGIIQLSSDEGATWGIVDTIPAGKAIRLIQHPYDNSMAFVLGRGATHWVTYNRGSSWLSWEMDRDANLMSDAVMSFHAENKDWILLQTTFCEDTGKGRWGSGKSCWDETYYTQDAFRTEPTLLLSQTSSCMFARSTPAFSHVPESLIFCVAFDSSNKAGGVHNVRESRLYSSENWFEEGTFVDLGIGKKAQGVVGLGVVSKFMVVALKVNDGLGTRAAAGGTAKGDPMHLYVSTDGREWRLAKFPHSIMPNLRENAYTVVESTTHSLAIDVLTEPDSDIGTLFVSSAEGEYFVEALADTNRNSYGIVDFEGLTGLEGVALANIVKNREEVAGWNEVKKLKTMMTYDDGSSWRTLKPPMTRLNGDSWSCNPDTDKECTLHLHSVSEPHNYGKVFSSTAPGFVMGVGSVGSSLLDYEDCDTFISSDAGLTWKVVQNEPHKYEFGDQGSLLVVINDLEPTDHVLYSYDFGQTWNQLDLGVTIRAILLTTIPDSTSQKFLVLGTLSRSDSNSDGRFATVFLDFATLQNRKCGDKDFEKWYARSEEGKECLMGHKQWYQRRKPDAACYVGDKFKDPVATEEDCPCTDEDYECDFNFVRQDGECVAAGLEQVPAGQCQKETDTFLGSSGYRKIPGNTCVSKKGSAAKDAPVEKSCELAKPEAGQVSHVIHDFNAAVTVHNYFPKSQTVLVQLDDSSVWQSSNEGFSWKRLYDSESFLGVIMHLYAPERAYLVTKTRKVYYTTDTGSTWSTFNAPSEANAFGAPILDFHPTRPDWLIYTGSSDCSNAFSENCRSISYYSTNHGRNWRQVEEYVRSCAWARDTRLKIDEREIICESYRNKKGSQRSPEYNPMELVAGKDYYSKKVPLFQSVVGWATFSEYLVVAQLNEQAGTLSLQVSLDGLHFAEGQFPPSMRIENRAYTILESSTDSVFLHVTMNSAQGNEWGSIFKSNSNGTYYGLSVEHVNRNAAGYVDFEKGQKLGLDGIALINIVANPDDAQISGRKKLQTKITHNDGGSWKPLSPPAKDSLGRRYDCSSTSCALHIHGYTERRDPKATYSSPSAIGLMLAVGNVGEELAPYTDSDTFLTRDGGLTWEEIHKDAHLWEFGDSGSILIIANDEGPTDHVIYSTDEGLSWSEYVFNNMLRVQSIQTVPSDTSRKFMLIGNRPGNDAKSVIVHLDFSSVSNRKCVLKIEDPNHDDFELWSPSEVRDETCLFGRQTLYHRRVRDRDCYIGETLEQPRTVVRNCTCQPSDFECEFNYFRNAAGECVLVEGATPLSANTEYEQCDGYEEFWYERTAYRKIPYSSCEGGDRPDRGARHACAYVIGGRGHGLFFWGSILILPFAGAALVAWWVYNRSSRGVIRLQDHRAFGGSSGALSILASVPYFLLGVASVGVAWIAERMPFLNGLFASRSNYRQVPIDEDTEILNNFEDD